MTLHRELGTFLTVALVTILIWSWAASETRDRQEVVLTLAFAGGERDVIEPSSTRVTVTIEGSQLALQRAQALQDTPLRFERGKGQLKGESGTTIVFEVAGSLLEHERLAATGVTVISTQPASINLQLDELVDVEAPVRLTLPATQLDGDPVVTPDTVTLRIPKSLRDRRTVDFIVDAVGDRQRLQQLAPGRQHEMEIQLRAPEGIDNATRDRIQIEPPRVTAKFALRSQIAETLVESVRLQVACPHEVLSEFNVDLETTTLSDVTVSAPRDVIARIESGEAVVLGFVHLSSLECESGIESKPVTVFMALDRAQRGLTRGTSVDVSIGDGVDAPTVALTITRVATPTTTP